MAFSAFNAFGHLRFSSRPPHGELIYKDTVRNLGSGENYSDDFDSLAMARVYANAMAFARARYAIERAGSQFRPKKALELLPALESEYGIIPEDDETITDRRTTLAALMRVARGAKRINVEAVMTELLGDAFVAYVTVDKSAAVVSHATPANVGVYVEPGTPRSVFRLTNAITTLGVQLVVNYEAVIGSKQAVLVGERVIVDAGDHDRIEAVTVTATGARTFTATFLKPHNPGTLVATGRHPHLISSKRHNLFILSASAISSERQRRKANRIIRRLLRGVSTWSLAEESTAGQSGPFKVGEGKLGITTIGAVTF